MDLVWEKLNSDTLVWGGQWEDVKSSVRAKTFGKMLELARDRVQFYVGDLFHDALWIEQELNGPAQFDWIVRESGTFIGKSVLYIKMEDWPGVFKYRLDVREDNGKWILDIYQAVPMESRPNVPDSTNDPLSDLLEAGIWVNPRSGSVPRTQESMRHERLPVEECEAATTAAGCIYHPADIAQPPAKSGTASWTIEKLMEGPEIKLPGVNQGTVFPTLENKIEEPLAPKRKGNRMLEEIISNIQEKLEELTNAREEAENGREALDQFLSETEDAESEYQEAVRLLERISLPDVSVNVNVDVSFDS